MCAAIRASYTQVSPDDFEYMGKVADGKFGLMLHCLKKSTGRKYMLKIQLKAGLLNNFHHNPARIMVEMRANSICQHSNLMSLAYAFQTPTLVVMAIPFFEYIVLSRLLSKSKHSTLPLLLQHRPSSTPAGTPPADPPPTHSQTSSPFASVLAPPPIKTHHEIEGSSTFGIVTET